MRLKQDKRDKPLTHAEMPSKKPCGTRLSEGKTVTLWFVSAFHGAYALWLRSAGGVLRWHSVSSSTPVSRQWGMACRTACSWPLVRDWIQRPASMLRAVQIPKNICTGRCWYRVHFKKHCHFQIIEGPNPKVRSFFLKLPHCCYFFRFNKIR